jgi:DNA-binding TFAR19-related protein (PDSD5 family)
MTDKEIALELGRRLINAQMRVTAMAAELDSLRDDSEWHYPPWRSNVQAILDDVLTPAAQERIEALQLALDEAKGEDALHTLQRFLKENF